jgi:hypothetical protein
MEHNSRSRHCKFFRGLIASRRPEEISKILSRYKKQLESTESNYLDIVIKSGGLLTYAEVMSMPIDSIALFVSRLNNFREEQNQANKQQRR